MLSLSVLLRPLFFFASYFYLSVTWGGSEMHPQAAEQVHIRDLDAA